MKAESRFWPPRNGFSAHFAAAYIADASERMTMNELNVRQRNYLNFPPREKTLEMVCPQPLFSFSRF